MTAFNVKYTNKDIVEKIDGLTIEVAKLAEHVKSQNGTIKFHTKLIWGSFGFTLAVLISLIGLYG